METVNVGAGVVAIAEDATVKFHRGDRVLVTDPLNRAAAPLAAEVWSSAVEGARGLVYEVCFESTGLVDRYAAQWVAADTDRRRCEGCDGVGVTRDGDGNERNCDRCGGAGWVAGDVSCETVAGADSIPVADRAEGEPGGDLAGMNGHSNLKGGSFAELPITRIHPSTFNPRKHFDTAKLQELADSIREDGLIEPIVVRQDAGNPGDFEIVAGERRWRAHKLAGLTTIQAYIRDVDDRHARVLTLVENLQRRDLNPVEEARGYDALRAEGLTTEQVADRVRRSRPAVSNAIRLLGLPEAVLARVESGELKEAHARALLRWAAFPKLCDAIAFDAMRRGLGSKDLETDSPPESYQLERSGLIKRLGWNMSVWPKECNACPFGAFFGDGNREAICAKPEHWLELEAAEKVKTEERLKRQAQAQAEAREKVKAQAVRGAKIAENGAKAAISESTEDAALVAKSLMPRLEDLGADGFIEITSTTPLPAGCCQDCYCRVTGRLKGNVVDACIDPKNMETLRRREKLATNKAKRAELAATWDRLDAAFEAGVLGSRSLSLILWEAVGHAQFGYSTMADEVLKTGRYDALKPIKALDKAMRSAYGPELVANTLKLKDAVAAADPQLLAAFLAELIVRSEIKLSITEASTAVRSDWLAAGLPAVAAEAYPTPVADSGQVDGESSGGSHAAGSAQAGGAGVDYCWKCRATEKVSRIFGVCSACEPDAQSFQWAIWWAVFANPLAAGFWGAAYERGISDSAITAGLRDLLSTSSGDKTFHWDNVTTELKWGVRGGRQVYVQYGAQMFAGGQLVDQVRQSLALPLPVEHGVAEVGK